MKKRILAVFIATILIIGGLPCNVVSAGDTTQGESVVVSTEGDYEYTITEDTATITKYNGSDTIVTIPSTLGGKTVTKIGERAFSDNTELTEITIPNTVTEIGYQTFLGCTSLETVHIPKSLTSGGNAFSECSKLKTITFEEGITKIPDYFFYGCTGLTEVR